MEAINAFSVEIHLNTLGVSQSMVQCVVDAPGTPMHMHDITIPWSYLQEFKTKEEQVRFVIRQVCDSLDMAEVSAKGLIADTVEEPRKDSPRATELH